MTQKDKIDRLLTLSGTLVPLCIFTYGLLKRDPNEKNILKDVLKKGFANPVATALSMDLIISSIAFNREAHKEIKAKRAKGPFLLYFLSNWVLGLSSAYPLFLSRRK